MSKEERDAKAREIEARWWEPGSGIPRVAAGAFTYAAARGALIDIMWLLDERARLIKRVTELHEENERLKGGAR